MLSMAPWRGKTTLLMVVIYGKEPYSSATRSDGTQPAPKRPLILSIGGKRYQIRIDANITPVPTSWQK